MNSRKKNKVLLINPPLYFSNGKPFLLNVSVPPLGILYLVSNINKYFLTIVAEVVDVVAEGFTPNQIGSLILKKIDGLESDF